MMAMDLQRMVDGELNHQQRAELLLSLGEDSGQWRALALALLEEQQWTKEIRLDAMHMAATSPASMYEAAIELGASIELAAKNTANRGSESSRFSSSRFSSIGSMNWFTALAASALLCVGIAGGMAYRASQSAIPSSDLAERNEVTPPTELMAAPVPPRTAEPMRMLLSGTNGSQSEIPLVDAREIDPRLVMANNAYEIAKLNQQLRRKGYRLDVQPQIYSGRLNDGRQVVVPVHNVALKSVGL